jgi:hypothetical protein
MPKELSEVIDRRRAGNGQSKKEKMINSGLKKINRKLKIEQRESHLKPGRNSVGDNSSL